VRYRNSYLDYTTEPHNVPLQFLSEVGVVGLALFLLAAAALLRGTHRRRRHELALALLLPAYLVHSLVDIDWDFAAVSAPAFLAAGAVVGRAELRRVSAFGSTLVAGAGLLLFAVLLMPWLGERWSNEASVAASPAHAISLAKKARSVDPLLVEPLWWQADAQTDPQKAVTLYQEAVDKQPKNAQTWLAAGLYGVSINCPRLAYYYLERFTELDPKARPSQGADAYREALRQVNTGKPRC
jgi:tetratricopeptide (TPR) repeat protein